MNFANKLTMLRILLIPLFLACFYIKSLVQQWNYIAAFIFIAAYLTDIFDGNYARSHNIVTTFGKFMDPIADKMLTGSAVIMLVSEGMLSPLAAIIFIGREFLISGFRLIAANNGTVIAASWLGKVKTVTQCIAVVIILLKNPLFGLIGIRMDIIMLAAALVFTIWSGFDYIYKNRKLIRFE
ncbi:MAG: CDP-diacylglycerol--glycerol-3-phosphate 3-phosphatidyltransferase [Firmicutes bacterium ADurb.Bin182]|nr:MAG: CDP-diacylglycerol--glycerol-3-phosphate 3-phosphatidyltransferase [Firmicutes bacterium ADurb.Bin182]